MKKDEERMVLERTGRGFIDHLPSCCSSARESIKIQNVESYLHVSEPDH